LKFKVEWLNKHVATETLKSATQCLTMCLSVCILCQYETSGIQTLQKAEKFVDNTKYTLQYSLDKPIKITSLRGGMMEAKALRGIGVNC